MKSKWSNWLSFFFFLFFNGIMPFLGFTQELKEVSFQSTDGLEITADLYHSDKSNPTLILFHQSVSSRGEYRAIAPRLQAQGFNCLAVDLRWGKQDFWNKIPNETAKRSGAYEIIDNYERTEEYQLNHVWPVIWMAYEDMNASFEYLRAEGYNKKIVVVGSSFSAMLVFKMVFDGLPVDGVVVFSPGEYHPTNDSLLSEWASRTSVPVYMSAGSGELEMIEKVRASIPENVPAVVHQSAGRHGASVLISEEDDWPPLNDFLKQFDTKQAIGFEVLELSRKSEKWDEGMNEKPINAWFWYPLENPYGNSLLSMGDYVKRLNHLRSENENVSVFERLVSSMSEDSIGAKSLQLFLETKKNDVFRAQSKEGDTPLVVLSGAHPVYFIALAEKLAQAGYSVLSVPKTGNKKGGRLPFSEEGVYEYSLDLNATLDYVVEKGLVYTEGISFISWSFEGVPTLMVALERNAKCFISLDSSIGYKYGEELLSKEIFEQKWPFKLLHYTSSNVDFGKSLNLLEQFPSKVSISKKFDLTHSEFTALHSITVPKLTNNRVSEVYEALMDEILSQLKTNL